MPDTIILRFRDAGSGTIANHTRLITAAGYVWWGWWKKESEPNRFGELDQLQVRFNDVSPLTIGLFDRSSNTYFLAQLTGCVFNNEKIGSPESRNTPKYYAHAKMPAWFRLIAIDEVSEESFRDEFGDVPSGEGTFFPVWRGRTPSVSASVSITDVIPLPSGTLIHLSDIHLGADFGFPREGMPGRLPLIDVLARDLERVQIGLIIISGDITTRADANVLLGDGLTFVKTLTQVLKINPERVVIVPGNHDLALKNYTFYDYSHETAFRLFLKEFYGKDVELFDLRRFSLPTGRLLEILTVNSVRLRKNEERNFGYVQWPLYDDLLRQIEHDPNTFRAAVLHHHLVPAPREESLDPDYPEASVSTTLDAGAVIEGLQTHGFHLALHGHQHVPAISKVARGRLTEGNGDVEGLDNELLVLAAGSAGAGTRRLSDAMRENSFNLITVGDKNLVIEARRYTPGVGPRPHFRYVRNLG